jgi:hypothetical protein
LASACKPLKFEAGLSVFLYRLCEKMENLKNYSKYHLHELHRALANIDEKQNPEESRIIREHIDQGGYQYPAGAALVTRSTFTSDKYKWSIVTLITALFLTNTLSLLSGDLIALIPMTLQGALLFMIFSNHKGTRGMLKAWAILLMVSGSLNIFSSLYDAYATALEVVIYLALISIGLVFFILTNHYIKLISDNETSKAVD